ncbi:hypothetical protein RFI_20670 [Reticulomyxa filosa]|uniref:Viral A-type inclusion protein n=1 Tax=Reticulomyxa filosa TaxID=46433 RepID=X6MU72_RETFI|nr:hypothetical protein RFI_20670 [Reticulomyxa filosa]|eukprot:ETO16670.1 hypothetical protein RFI_20670 [Reticulomyxa filosa]
MYIIYTYLYFKKKKPTSTGEKEKELNELQTVIAQFNLQMEKWKDNEKKEQEKSNEWQKEMTRLNEALSMKQMEITTMTGKYRDVTNQLATLQKELATMKGTSDALSSKPNGGHCADQTLVDHARDNDLQSMKQLLEDTHNSNRLLWTQMVDLLTRLRQSKDDILQLQQDPTSDMSSAKEGVHLPPESFVIKSNK